MSTTQWYNTDAFRILVARAYPDTVTVDVLSIEEVKLWQLETTPEERMRIEDAYEVVVRTTDTATGATSERSHIVVMTKPTLELAKNVRRKA